MLLFIVWLLFGYLGSRMARRKNRNPMIWFFLCTFFGLVALTILFFLRPIKVEAPVPPPAKPKPAPLISFWYYLDAEEQQYGPLSTSLLKEALSEDKVKYIWNETLDNWKNPAEITLN